MRVTIDHDSHNPINLLITLAKGLVLFKKFPKIRKTGRGFHYIYYNLPISEEKSYIYRKVLGDDPKRIKLDLDFGKVRKQTQILFFKKQIKIYKKGKMIFKTFNSNKKLRDMVSEFQ